ncbi:hypothetical protein EDD21DRAFT_382104 [Dissophora ornata]|nr:hypothetical protein EDD21DRAFT_382104 [Dissophora ornata]
MLNTLLALRTVAQSFLLHFALLSFSLPSFLNSRLPSLIIRVTAYHGKKTRGEKKKHDREYHSENSAIGSRKGFYNVVITRDFSKTPPYYYCTGNGCQTANNYASQHET